jgi:hypothetical protein
MSWKKSAKPIILNDLYNPIHQKRMDGGKSHGIIKKETIIKENYANIYIEHSRNKEKMNEALMAFLVYYMLYR